jgi:hypothetical protein
MGWFNELNINEGGSNPGNFLDWVYPVGSIYMSTNSVNPSILFGGTWEQISGQFLLGAGNGYTAGSTGGEATHTLLASEMPLHAHSFGGRVPELRMDNIRNVGVRSGSVGNYMVPGGPSEWYPVTITGGTGGNKPHNNMPPYLVVYMWQRIS